MEKTNTTAATTATSTELSILKAKQDAEFALTPTGQMVKTFEVQQRMAQMYATSTIIPETYRGNLGNCVIALDMAQRMGANPLMVMQNLYIVHGNPSFSSKFLVASVNASGRYSSLRYEWQGEKGKPSWGCRCVAYEKTDTKKEYPLAGTWVTIDMAEKEGWTKKPGSKWLTMPELMLQYRAAAFWQRAFCPEISMGFLSSEEYEDNPNATVVDGGFAEVLAERDADLAKQETTDLSMDTPDAPSAQPTTTTKRTRPSFD